MAQNFILRTTVSKGVNLVNDGNVRQNKGIVQIDDTKGGNLPIRYALKKRFTIFVFKIVRDVWEL